MKIHFVYNLNPLAAGSRSLAYSEARAVAIDLAAATDSFCFDDGMAFSVVTPEGDDDVAELVESFRRVSKAPVDAGTATAALLVLVTRRLLTRDEAVIDADRAAELLSKVVQS